MKLKHLLIAILTFPISATAQEIQSPLLFENYEWDFGNIEEVNGIVTHTFRFANVSHQPVQLDIISTSCGCTTAEYSTEPIPAGDYGEITVHFSPARTEGKVFREVEVFTKGRKSVDRLTIMADVTPMPMGINELYPHPLAGTVRTNNMRCNFGYISQGNTVDKTIKIANSSQNTVKLSVQTTGNRYGMKVSCPESIGPEEITTIKVTYTIPKNRNAYGMTRDSIWLVADGEKSASPLLVSALRIEQLNKDENAPKPVMRVEPAYVDFGSKAPGKVYKQTVTIENTGNADLIFRDVEACTGTTTTLTKGTVVKPGKQIKVTVTLENSKELGETTMGSINLTSNDPTRPFRELRLQVDTKK